MGAWGHKALESDAGLDVVDFVKKYIAEKYRLGDVQLTLAEIVKAMKKDGFFGKSFEDIDFYYDHSAMALAELYTRYKETGELTYGDEEEASRQLRRIKSFQGDEASVQVLLRYLTDIRDEVPDQDGERELVELWKDSDSWEDWKANLLYLIEALQAEIE